MSGKITSVDTKTGKQTTMIIKGNKVKGLVIRDGKVYKRSFISSILYKIKKFISKFIK
jgi:hypothetical protein